LIRVHAQWVAQSLSTPAIITIAIAVAFVSGCSDTFKSSLTPDPPAISVTLSPTSASVQTGQVQMFTATVANDSANKGVSWTLTGAGCSGATCGTLSAASSASGAPVTYTAPAAIPNPATVTLTAASVADGTKTAAATITTTAVAGISVTLSATSATVPISTTAMFTATVANDSGNKGVNWTLTGAGCSAATCGTLSAASSASGTPVTYTAPAAVPTPPTVSLTATSVADGTKTAAATITITAAAGGISVTLSATTATVPANATTPFTATVANDAGNKGVNWTLSGTGCSAATCGTVAPATSASGVAVTYTAPAAVPTPPLVTLTATSVADATKTATAAITVTVPASGVTITPIRGGLTLGQSMNFTATTTPPGGTITWTASSGTITPTPGTSNATYVAPTSPGVVTITATDGMQIGTATMGVTDLAGVTTYHNDLSRDGVNAQEYALNTTNVTTATFGKLFSCAADGAIYAQPLWMANVNIGGEPHNVIVAATAHDSVYAFDADASPCVAYWHANLLDSTHGGTAGETSVPSGLPGVGNGTLVGLGFADINPETGVIGTPVIDVGTGTIYVVSKSVIPSGSTSVFFQRIHALDLASGAEKFSGPAAISASVPGIGGGGSGGTVPFNAQTELQRPGLALVNGVVYVTWASHEDSDPYHGWVIGYNASTLAQVSVFNDTPNGDRGGIWMSGGAPAADSSTPDPNLFLITGNGTYNGTDAYGDSFLKLSTDDGIGVADWFTPSTQATLESTDKDFGAGGAAVLIDQTSGPLPRLAVGGGKDQNLFLINRDNMGHNNSTTNQVVQTLAFGNAIFATPAFWQNSMYLAGAGGTLKQYAFDTVNRVFNTSLASQSGGTFGFPGATPSISSQGATNGIVWALNSNSFGANGNSVANKTRAAGPAVLHAYSAANLGTELWNSSQATGGRDTAGDAVKFTVPTVANGKVYIGTRGNDDTLTANPTTPGEIDVYGLLPN
jgi:hypothetical protein